MTTMKFFTLGTKTLVCSVVVHILTLFLKTKKLLNHIFWTFWIQSECLVSPAVEGGQRAIIFNRIGGMQKDTVLAEGLHFRLVPRRTQRYHGNTASHLCNVQQSSFSSFRRRNSRFGSICSYSESVFSLVEIIMIVSFPVN